jgi:CRISPR system Cascade subunit CasD
MYLADALFIVGLEGDPGLLGAIRERLEDPAFPLSLGRATCLPAAPIAMRDREDGGLLGMGLEAALRSLIPDGRSWCSSRHSDRAEAERRIRRMRMIVECEPQYATIRVQDQPTPFAFATRSFTTRYARSVDLEEPDA